ncbi:MAG: hypothetical protein KDK53_19810, partial [Maritimibacter sp.]|nr:hypothetical protein [Maritimibacter sp.]
GPQGMGQGGGQGMGPQAMGNPWGAGPQAGGGFGGAADEFAMLDADGDGVVTTEEFVAPGTDWLTRFDRNGDGTVTIDDFGTGRR